MIVIDGKEYRNLEEQVLKNMEDIKTLQEEQQADILNEDNTFNGNNTFKGNLYRPNTNGGGQLIVNHVMAGLSFSNAGDQTGQVAITSAGASITGLVSPVYDNDAANKQYVDSAISAIDLSGYVEKTTQANKLYGTTTNGGNTLYNVSGGATQYNVVQRTTNGNILLPHKAWMTDDNYAVSKKYVDDQIATIDTSSYVSKSTNPNIVYGTNPDGTPKLWGVGNVATNYLINRTTNGNVLLPAVSAITNGNYAASKAYVDSVATQGGSTYTIQVESNTVQATITYCWKIGKMITFYGQFNDGLNGGTNYITVASGDTISHGYIQSADNVMAFGSIHDNYAKFDEESGATTSGLEFNGRNFVGVIWLT